MALSIIQAGSALQLVDDTGVVSTLTLPTGVTLRDSVPPRWAVYGRYVVLTNTPSQPLTIDANGTVRLLTPRPPRLAPVLSGVTAGSLSGTYRSKMTNVIFDDYGNVVAESDFSPISSSVTIASKFLRASNLDISQDSISGRRLYRTATDGAVYFQWVDLDGNVLTTVEDDLSDAGLSLVAAPTLGTPPRLTTIAEFRGRLFGTSDVNIDALRYTEAGLMYSWPTANSLAIPGGGSDKFGVVALAPRREALGVGRRNMLVQIVGSGASDSSGQVDFDIVVLSRELGIESQESVKVFRDIAFFLWKDGVYSWSSDGIKCVSDGAPDGKGAVRSWFTTDDFFNRERFPYAFAEIDPARPCYRLFLASAGSTTIDRWVEYDMKAGTWWGPHSTALFSPKSAFYRTNSANRVIPVIGGTTAVYQEQTTRTDGSATGIAFDAIGKRHDFGDPDVDKYFGQISLHGEAQASGTLSVVTRMGALDATTTLTQSFDMTKTRERLGRLGTGKHAQVELTNSTAGVDVELFGYEIDPVHVLGRR